MLANADYRRREGAPGIARAMVPKLLGQTTQAEQPELADVVRALIVANPADAIADGLFAIRDRPHSTPLLPSIGYPTVVITGDEDAIIPVSEAEFIQRSIPGAALRILPRVGHLSDLEGEGVSEVTAAIARVGDQEGT